MIHLAGQRNKQVRLEKINKEIAEYQFEEVMLTLRQELNEKFVEVYFLSKSIAIYEKEVNSLQVLLGGMKIQQEKGNISLMEISRLESMLFSLRKEKNERENDLLTTRGELNLLLNLPEDTQVQLSLDVYKRQERRFLVSFGCRYYRWTGNVRDRRVYFLAGTDFE